MSTRCLTVVGNRPQFVKAAAVWAHLRQHGEQLMVHTGQHYDRDLSEIFFDELGLLPAEFNLGAGSGSHAQQTAAIMTGLESLVHKIEPDALLVYGDTNSTLAGALVGAKEQVPLAHVEAGMRSFDRTMPEEVNRVVADATSDLLLCSTNTAIDNLQAEGMGERARLVGDLMADVAVRFGPIAERRSDVLARLNLEPREYVLVTAHRAGNVDDPERLWQLASLLCRVADASAVIFPVHPRTRSRLVAAELVAGLEQSGVRLTEPLGYLDFTCLLRSAKAVFTDSGGVQKEAYLAAVPCLTMRETTEWVETVESGWNRLVGLDESLAVRELDEIDRRTLPPPDIGIYGGGKAGQRTAEEVTRWLES